MSKNDTTKRTKSQSEAGRSSGHLQQSLGHVEKSGKSGFDETRPQGQRAGKHREADQGFEGHGQRHNRKLRTELAKQRNRDFNQHGGSQKRRSQFHGG